MQHGGGSSLNSEKVLKTARTIKTQPAKTTAMHDEIRAIPDEGHLGRKVMLKATRSQFRRRQVSLLIEGLLFYNE